MEPEGRQAGLWYAPRKAIANSAMLASGRYLHSTVPGRTCQYLLSSPGNSLEAIRPLHWRLFSPSSSPPQTTARHQQIRPDCVTCHANLLLTQPDTLPRTCAGSSLHPVDPLPLPLSRRRPRNDASGKRTLPAASGRWEWGMASAGVLHPAVERLSIIRPPFAVAVITHLESRIAPAPAPARPIRPSAIGLTD